MSEQEERERRIVKGEQEEPKDEIEAHRKRAATEEAPSDEDSEEVEAHRRKV